ncbi:MAG: hypothetical protein COA86_06875 [Kangiella sp.]|nr:MAG: hypothetical protein COA86_06875 [Kangiella sp.]
MFDESMNQESNLPLSNNPALLNLANEESAEICANCNTALSGQFCHSCGQSSKSMIKFFGDVIKELMDDALGYDSRFKHSLMPLLFKPGRLTLDYVKGKRFHYVLPFKLYLITSVLFILLIKNTTDTDGIKFDNDDATQQEIATLSKEEKIEKAKEKIEQTLEKLPAITDEIKQDILDAVEDEQKTSASGNKAFTLGGGKKDIDLEWNAKTQQLDGVEEIESPILKKFFTQINPKLKEWKKDSAPLVESIIEMIPYMMFIILPIFAIFLKLFYLFSKRFYTEHLIFLLHNHSFIYMLMMLQIGLGAGEKQLDPINHWLAQSASMTFSFISLVFNFWMFIYVFLSMKRFYRQSWKMTITKTIALGFVYSILLSFGIVISIVFGAYQA